MVEARTHAVEMGWVGTEPRRAIARGDSQMQLLEAASLAGYLRFGFPAQRAETTLEDLR